MSKVHSPRATRQREQEAAERRAQRAELAAERRKRETRWVMQRAGI